MLTVPGSTRLWRGRYRSAGGAWRWVETVNENHLHEPEEYVRSTMTAVMRIPQNSQGETLSSFRSVPGETTEYGALAAQPQTPARVLGHRPQRAREQDHRQ